MWTLGVGVKLGRTGREIGIDIYALPCVRQRASENLLDGTGNSARVLRTQRGGMRGLREGDPRGRGCMYT